MLATIMSGEVDLADVLFLIAFVVFAVAFVLRVMVKNVDGALVAAGLALVSFAWLAL